MRHGLAIVAAFCTAGLIGCSGQSSPSGQQQAESQQAQDAAQAAAPAQPQAIAVPVDASADQVVSTFLDAIRRGDSATTEALLTTKARAELEKNDFAVVPQATPNMQFEVLGIQAVGDGGAHVTCRWTEKYEDGDESDDVVWVLRRQSDGWRIAGLAMQLIPQQPPQFLNFEDVADMERKREEAMAAMQEPAAETPAAETAQQPATQTPGAHTTLER